MFMSVSFIGLVFLILSLWVHKSNYFSTFISLSFVVTVTAAAAAVRVSVSRKMFCCSFTLHAMLHRLHPSSFLYLLLLFFLFHLSLQLSQCRQLYTQIASSNGWSFFLYHPVELWASESTISIYLWYYKSHPCECQSKVSLVCSSLSPFLYNCFSFLFICSFDFASFVHFIAISSSELFKFTIFRRR